MGNHRISKLTALGAALATDELPVARAGGTIEGKLTISALVALGAENWLSGLVHTEVSLTADTPLDATAFGKWHVLSDPAGAFTVTLPAVSGNGGKYIAFRAGVGTYLLSYYVIKDESAVTLATLMWNNILILRCTGTAWVVAAAVLRNEWRDSGALAVTAVTTNPEKPAAGNILRDKVWIRRQGSELWVRYEYLQDAAGSAGSGVYLFGVPYGTIDAAQVVISTGVAEPANMADSFLGTWSSRSTTAMYGVGSIAAYSTNQLKVSMSATSSSAADRQFIRSTASRFGLGSTALSWGGEAHLPITEFKVAI